MDKIKLGAKNFLYPMPIVIVGALADDKPNFCTVAYCGIVQNQPPMISVTLGKRHHTNKGIHKQKSFSVNIPSEDMIKVTDYIGLYSGKSINKADLFNVFFGGLKNAPMIEECPVNLECKLVDILDYGSSNEIFVGEIVETYSREAFTESGLPDIKRVRPVAFSMYDGNYWSVGKHLGKAWEIGENYPD